MILTTKNATEKLLIGAAVGALVTGFIIGLSLPLGQPLLSLAWIFGGFLLAAALVVLAVIVNGNRAQRHWEAEHFWDWKQRQRENHGGW